MTYLKRGKTTGNRNDVAERPIGIDIACEAGVSLATVDRFLNERPGVRKKTILAIVGAITKLGYVRNVTAVNLAWQRNYRMAFVLHDTESQFLQTLRAELETAAAVAFTAYAFSRFKVPLKEDLLFFILSTQMMPPIAVAIPIFLMYRDFGLSDTHSGMILLYTGVNISLAVWLLKAS